MRAVRGWINDRVLMIRVDGRREVGKQGSSVEDARTSITTPLSSSAVLGFSPNPLDSCRFWCNRHIHIEGRRAEARLSPSWHPLALSEEP